MAPGEEEGGEGLPAATGPGGRVEAHQMHPQQAQAGKGLLAEGAVNSSLLIFILENVDVVGNLLVDVVLVAVQVTLYREHLGARVAVDQVELAAVLVAAVFGVVVEESKATTTRLVAAVQGRVRVTV